jgi:hypothetical protein
MLYVITAGTERKNPGYIDDDEMGRACSTNGEKRNAYRILVGKPEGKRPLGRPRRRWEDNIRMDLIQIGWGGMDWIDVAQDRDQWRALVNTVMNLLVTKMLGNFLVAAQLAASQEGLSSMELVILMKRSRHCSSLLHIPRTACLQLLQRAAPSSEQQ